MNILLLDEQTIDTTGTQETADFNGGTGVAAATGVFDGCTVKLQCFVDGSWVDLGTNTTFTTNGIGGFQLPAGYTLRGSVSSAGASTSVNLRVTV